MEEKVKRCHELFSRWYQQELADSEMPELWALLAEADRENRLEPMMRVAYDQLKNDSLLGKERISEMAAAITGKPKARVRRISIGRWVAAASVLMVLATAVYIIGRGPRQEREAVAEKTPALKEVQAPASSKAAITLDNGQVIYLDSMANGQLAKEANMSLVKLPNGQIAYQPAAGDMPERAIYNTLVNPRGSQPIDMMLSDGSHVWLNAGSSLTYPVFFIGSEREVTLKGEGYFEIAKDPTKKFIVSANGMQTEVLGTHFNINAYSNEPNVRVTLVEGSVRVSRQGETGVTIKPGQLASAQTSGAIQVMRADVEKETAWKNGLFNLEGVTLREAMRQLERWYDIEVIYETGSRDIELTGKMTRGVTLNGLMIVLRELGVHYRLEGRKLIILP